MAEERAQWGNSLEFILTVIGFAVGLGNVWRFPFLVFDNGGGPFLIIFFVMLFLVGIPMFFLELALGQFSALGPTHTFYRMAPIFQGLGYAALTINAFIGFYYNVIIAYCLEYLFLSMNSELPWASCNNTWNDGKCVQADKATNCSLVNYTNATKTPSEQYFYNKVLNITGGIEDLGGIQWPIALSLLGSWTIVFLALSKGVQSLGKVSYFTATFPYIVLTILVIFGSILDGASKGINFYVGPFTNESLEKFSDPGVWKAATVQVFYALSACTGGLIAMASFNPFKNNILRDSLLIPILDCLTGFYAGFAIFTVLGSIAKSKCVPDNAFEDVVAGGPELAFVVYPEGLSLAPVVPPLWSILFFLMMLALGYGSEFSIMETFMTMVMDTFQNVINTKWRKIATRGVICLVFFLLGLSMTSRGGFYILSLIDSYVAGYPLLVVGILQVIVVPWVYGVEQFILDIECMIGKKPRWFWMIWIVAWKFITPLVLIAITIATIILGDSPGKVNGVEFPPFAIGIGWVIVAIPFSLLIGCAIAQAYIHRQNWRALFRPHPDYYKNRDKNLLQTDQNSHERPSSTTKVSPLFDTEHSPQNHGDEFQSADNYDIKKKEEFNEGFEADTKV